MRRLLLTLALVAVPSLATRASAQETPAPEAPPPGAQPAGEPAPLEALYERALDSLVAGDLDGALAALDQVAAQSVDPVRRHAAEDLARRIRARRLLAVVTPPATPSVPRLNQDGRFLLVGGTTAVGLGYYGWALPTALDIDDDRNFVGLYTLTAGSSFFLPWLATRSEEVTYGEAVLAFHGATRGIAHGVLMHSVVSGEGGEKGMLAAGMAASVLEGAAGYAWARKERMDPGTAHAIENGGDLGILWGFCLNFLLGLDDLGDPDDADVRDMEARARGAVTLLTAAATTAGGKALADRRDYTWGDAEVMRTAALLGIHAATMVLDWIDASSDRTAAAVVLAGSAAGAAVGDRLVGSTDFSVGESIMVDLGTVGGALIGLGGAYFLTPRDFDEATPFITASAAGATAGYAVTYLALRSRSRGKGGTVAGLLPPQLMPYAGAGGERGLVLAGTF